MREAAGLTALAACLGLCGITWGLPSRARVALVMPAGLDNQEFHKELENSWVKMHARLGANLMLNPEAYATFAGVERFEAGWSFPPAGLINSVRSFYTRSAHEDEQTNLLVLSRMKPRNLDFNPHFFAYGGAYIYALGAWLAASAALGLVSLHGGLAPYLADPGKMGALYLAGRLFSVAAYAGCALMLLRIGRRHFDSATGALAALLFLLLPTSVALAHTMKHYTYWTFIVLLLLDRCAALLGNGGWRLYAAAGALSGLAVGAFIPSWPAVLVVACVAVVRVVLGRGAVRFEARGLALAALCSAAAFALSNPYWVLDFKNAYAEISGMARLPVSLWNPVLFARGALRRSMTLPMLGGMFCSAAWALTRGRRDPPLFFTALAFVIGMAVTVMINGAPTSWARYVLAWTAVGSLLTARAALEVLRSCKKQRAWILAALVFALVNQGLEALTYAENFRVDATPSSTHVLAGRWLTEHVPAGASVGLLRAPQPASVPYFCLNRYELRLIKSRLFGTLPGPELPRYLVLTMPDYDDRPALNPNLSRYERVAVFERAQLVFWLRVDPQAITANPLIEIYRLKDHA